MGILEAIILGIVQGLTEFLPVSSDGHLTLTTALLGVEKEGILKFDMVLHAGTALSSIIVFRKDILALFKGLLQFKWNEETKFVCLLIVSMIPVAIVGVFLKDQIDAAFEGNASTAIAGGGLIATAILMLLTLVLPKKDKELNWLSAFLIGIAQAAAVLPGLSRSGSTIFTGLALGISREKVARFSFLMVIVPILGKTLLDFKDSLEEPSKGNISTLAMVAGFAVSFAVGLAACKLMIGIVKKGKIWYFGVYCLIVGIIALVLGLRMI
jgi:undecaprenyl-diphosphatase